MAMHQLEFARSIALPSAKGIHEVVEAFFRTSEQGSWERDPSAASDLFVMNFMRGNWTTRRFSKERAPAAPTRDAQVATVVRTTAALGTVTVRPSPKGSVVTVRHRMYWPTRSECSEDRQNLKTNWERYTLAEVNSFRAYLAEWYQLPDLPALLEG